MAPSLATPPLGENRRIASHRLPPVTLLDLRGKKALVTGIANNGSIAWGNANQLAAAGCELGLTYLPYEKDRFEAKVGKLTAPLNSTLFEPLNVQGSGPD